MNDTNKPTPHPHAELIKAWADGAKIQFFNEATKKWEDCRSRVIPWNPETKYRIKPEETSNEPWKPEDKGEFYYLSGSLHTHRRAWCNMTYDNELFNAGNCFRTREEAEAAAKRVKAALKGELKISAPSGENFQLDGKPLTDGEKALIRALRDAKICLIPDFATSVLCYPSYNGKSVYSHGSPIAFTTSPATPSHVDEKIITALKQIQAEQEANNG